MYENNCVVAKVFIMHVHLPTVATAPRGTTFHMAVLQL